MTHKRNFKYLVVLELLFIIFLSLLSETDCSISENRCDTTTRETFTTNCINCWQNRKVSCPRGSRKQTRGAGNRGCRYDVRVGGSTRPAKGCTHTCGHSVTASRCCDGYWGEECQSCPKDSLGVVCGGKGKCFDGIEGNGTCACQGNLAGAFCEKCSQPQFYGPTCQSLCACVHGTCDNGINGTGTCYCENGFGGRFCEKVLEACSTLNCHMNSSCLNRTGQVRCHCNKGYSGNGVTCEEINPCITGTNKPCHSQATCVHTGPDNSTCQCNDGYNGDGYWCIPIDPCQTDSGGCPVDSTVCRFDGPAKAHCECKYGFENFTAGVGCALKDICGQYEKTTCDPLATCQTIVQYGSITVNCTCPPGFVENELICYGDLLTELEKLNNTGLYQNKLNLAIAFFKVTYKELLFTPNTWTLLVPVDEAFPPSLRNNISSDPLWKATARAHIISGFITINFTVESAKTMYPLLGSDYSIKAFRPDPTDDNNADDDDDGYFATIKFGGKSRGRILVDGRYASNGIMYMIDTLLEIPDQPYFVSNLGPVQTLGEIPNLSGFQELLSRSFTFRRKLLDLPSYSLFVPTSSALTFLDTEEYKYLMSPMGQSSLDILLQYHQFTEPTSMLAITRVKKIRNANGVITVNVTKDGIVTLGSEQAKIVMSEISVKGGKIFIYLIDKLLIPDVLRPLVSNRCNETKSVQSRGPCGHCGKTLCPPGGVALPLSNSHILTCVYKAEFESGDGNVRIAPHMGCTRMCQMNVTTTTCCPGFYGSECRSCPGPTHQACNDHGLCSSGESGTGLCSCAENFTSSDCSICVNQTKYGPQCDQDCICSHGICKNTIHSHGECISSMCTEGWAGENCDRPVLHCHNGSSPCHQFASCAVSSNGTERCVCDAGYTGSGEFCYEYNPCQGENWGGCDVNAYCLHLGAGITACECPPNYAGDGITCTAVDPCASKSKGNCSKNGVCIFTGPGESRCECKTGYRGDGKLCTEINICEENNGGCHRRARCTRTGPGTKTCQCFDGYDGDGLTCTGNILQEISLRSDLSEFNRWVVMWPAIRQMFIDLDPGFTCFLPDDSAWASLTNEQMEFWITEMHFPYLIKNHIIPKKILSSSLKTLAGNSIQTQLQSVHIHVNKVSVDTSDTNVDAGTSEKFTLPTLGKDYAKLMVSDLPVSKDGVVHIIDSVLLPPRDVIMDYPKLNTIVKNTTGTPLGNFKKFLGLLVSSGVIDQIEAMSSGSSYTIFAAPDSSPNFPASNATIDDIRDAVRYHVIIGRMLRQDHIRGGKHYDALSGNGSQLSVVRRHDKIIVNGQKVSVADVRTSRGIIHGLSQKLLELVKNRCNGRSTNYISTTCLPCSYPHRCPVSSLLRSKELCMFSHITNGEIKRTVGCSLTCAKSVVQPKCCPGYYGSDCEPCPGGIGNVCYGLGTCSDGIKGDGMCTCSEPKYAGLGCETCSDGKYGKNCGQSCSCVNGTCNDGVDGDGTCYCNKGYRGAQCDAVLDSNDACKGTCDSAAECIPVTVGSGGTCNCLAGYTGSGTSCKALNPCDGKDTLCGRNATCIYQSPGQYLCNCSEGFEGDGVLCREINPCTHGYVSKCHEQAYCMHTGPNMSVCTCNDNYEGDGKSECSEVNPCNKNNGGCSINAICKKTGPGERQCECKEDFVGDGVNCTGSIYTYVAGQPGYEWFNLMDSIASLVPHAFSSLGPLFVFLPPSESIMKISSNIRSSKEFATQLYLNHIIGCAKLDGSLANVTKMRTLAGSVLDISHTDTGYKINTEISVKDGPMEFWNGIVYLIDTPLMPESIAHLNTTATMTGGLGEILSKFLNPFVVNSSDTTSPADKNTKMLLSRGFTWMSSVLNKSSDLYLLQDEIHQKWTLFFPSDDAFNSMPAQKLRSLVNDPSYASEYIRYHMVRESFFTPINIASEALEETLKTMQGSDVRLSCQRNNDVMGEIAVNGGMAKVTGFRVFPVHTESAVRPAAVYVIDKVLEPPSIGGRCDIIKNSTISTGCRLCFGHQSKCPEGTKQTAVRECRANVLLQNAVTIMGCEQMCAVFNVTHKCCKNYYSSDCHPCPGGALKPCSGNGECSDGLQGTGVCKCKDGFTGYACERCMPARHGRNCLPCKCTVHGTCNEGMTGDGICYCDSGWTGSTCEQSTNTSLCNPPCHTNGYCVKSGTCFCKPGYRGDGVDVCEFMDMCRVNNGGCSPYATCSLGQNKVICKCLPNFVGDGYYCEGYDPCNASNTGCHPQARCVYVGANTSRCQCNEGYHGDGIRMCLRTQYTNCATNNGGCSGHATCTDIPANSQNGYPTTTCKCKPGYIGDGYVCHGNVLEVISESVEMKQFYKQLRRQSPRMRRKLSNPGINITMFVPADMQGHGKYRAMPPYAIARHLVKGNLYYYKNLLEMKAISMWSGDILPLVRNGSNDLFVNGVRVQKYDIIATNGVVHLLDSFITKTIVIVPTGSLVPPPTAKTSSTSTKKSMVKSTLPKTVTTAVATVKRGPIDGGGFVTNVPGVSTTKGPKNTGATQPLASTTSKKPAVDAASRRRRNNGIKIGVSVLIVAMILIVAVLIYWWRNRHSYVFRPFTERQRLTSSSDPVDDDNYGMTNPAYDSTGFNTVDDDDVLLTEADVDVAEAMEKSDEGPFTFENPGTS